MPVASAELSGEEFDRAIHNFMANGNKRKARVLCHRALTVYPDDFNLNQLMLSLYRDKGDLLSSIRQAKRCLELQPEDAAINTYVALWSLMILDGNYIEAKKYINQAIACNDEESSEKVRELRKCYFLSKLAITAYKQENTAEALLMFEKVIQNKEHDDLDVLAHGDILLRNGKVQEAQADFQRTVSESNSWIGRLYLGSSELLLGHKREAQGCFKQIIAADFPNVGLYCSEKFMRSKAKQGLSLTRKSKTTTRAISKLLGKPLWYLEYPWPGKIICGPGLAQKREPLEEQDPEELPEKQKRP